MQNRRYASAGKLSKPVLPWTLPQVARTQSGVQCHQDGNIWVRHTVSPQATSERAAQDWAPDLQEPAGTKGQLLPSPSVNSRACSKHSLSWRLREAGSCNSFRLIAVGPREAETANVGNVAATAEGGLQSSPPHTVSICLFSKELGQIRGPTSLLGNACNPSTEEVGLRWPDLERDLCLASLRMVFRVASKPRASTADGHNLAASCVGTSSSSSE